MNRKQFFRTLAVLSVFSLPLVFSSIALAQDRPKVVETVPAVRDRKVDPNLTEITVVFDRSMKRTSYSFHADPPKPERFPERTGEPTVSEDGRTWKFPVKLKPKKRYSLWLNSPKEEGFVGEDGTPAEWYKLIFRTTK